MSGVQANIPLQINPQAQAGPNIGAVIGEANGLLQFQQMQQQMQKANALQNILGRPGAVDAMGQPTPETMNQVMGVDVNAGMKLRQNALAQQEQALRTEGFKSKAFRDQMGLVGDLLSPILAGYDEDLKNGVPVAQATQNAQKATQEAYQRAKTSGAFAPAQLDRFPQGFDPIKMRAMVGGADNFLQITKEQSTERRLDQEQERSKAASERQGTELLTDSDGRPYVAHPNAPPGRNAMYLDGKPVPEEKLTGSHKVGTTGTSSAAAVEQDAMIKANAEIQRQEKEGPLTEEKKAEIRQKFRNEALSEKKAATTGAMTGRVAQMFGRGLTSAADAVSDMKNVVELPITIDRGLFGGRHQGPGLMAATKEVLANTVTPEDAQAYNASLAGLERALGGLATGGLQVNKEILDSFKQLQIVKGDTNLIKLRKLAIMRQNVDNALDAMSTNPQVGDKQAAMIEKLKSDVAKAVPWTPHDVNQVEFAKNRNVTVGDFAKKHVPDSSQEEAPSGGATPQVPSPLMPMLKAGTLGSGTYNGKTMYYDKATNSWFDEQGQKTAAPQTKPAAQPKTAPTSQATPQPAAGNAPAQQTSIPSGGIPVPPQYAHHPEGQTYGDGKYIKRGDRIVPNNKQDTSDDYVNLERARAALKAGAPREAVIKMLKDAGTDPGKL